MDVGPDVIEEIVSDRPLTWEGSVDTKNDAIEEIISDVLSTEESGDIRQVVIEEIPPNQISSG